MRWTTLHTAAQAQKSNATPVRLIKKSERTQAKDTPTTALKVHVTTSYFFSKYFRNSLDNTKIYPLLAMCFTSNNHTHSISFFLTIKILLCKSLKTKWGGVVIFLSLFILLGGCNKKAVEPTTLQGETGFLSLASVKNGRLHFKTTEDAKSYYEGLQKLSQQSNDEASVLRKVEKHYAYQSLLSKAAYGNSALRTENDSIEMVEDTVGLTEAELIASMHNDFIKDDLRKSILNEYYEVSIDDYVYVFFSENQIYKIKADAEEEIQNFRDAIKGNEIVQRDLITENVELISNIYTYRGNGAFWDFITGKTRLVIELVTPDPCNAPFRKHINILEMKIGGQPVNQVTQFTIDWGDGTVEHFNNHPTRTLINISHDYPTTSGSPQNFHITCSSSTINVNGGPDITADVTADVATYHCSFVTATKDTIIEGNSRGVKITIWYRNDLFGQHAGAKTEGRRKKSNGHWVEKWGHLSTKIYYNFRDVNNCSSYDSGSEPDDCNNCGSVRANKTHTGSGQTAIQNHDIKSEHSATFDNGEHFYYTFKIIVCS